MAIPISKAKKQQSTSSYQKSEKSDGSTKTKNSGKKFKFEAAKEVPA
jgi:hypothetical protein